MTDATALEKLAADHEAMAVQFVNTAHRADFAHHTAAAATIRAAVAEIKRLREALAGTHSAIAEYYRYQTGGETRGSYDGKPERANLWKAQNAARAALATRHG